MMKYTKEQIDSLISVSDPDGFWAILQEYRLQEESRYIELKYFNIG